MSRLNFKRVAPLSVVVPALALLASACATTGGTKESAVGTQAKCTARYCSAEGAMLQMMASARQARSTTSMEVANKVPVARATGFAGTPVAADREALRAAFFLATIAFRDSADSEAEMAKATRLVEDVPGLDTSVVSAVAAFASAPGGSASDQALSRVFTAALDGAGGPKARLHGYFATGIWLGLASATTAPPQAAFLKDGTMLVGMLREDAVFKQDSMSVDDKDRSIASEVSDLIEKLSKSSVDPATLSRISLVMGI